MSLFKSLLYCTIPKEGTADDEKNDVCKSSKKKKDEEYVLGI